MEYVQFPEHVLRLADATADEFRDDIAAAKESLQKRLRKLSDFDELVDLLITTAVNELIDRSRGRMNKQIKRDFYGGPSKVDRTGETALRIAETFLEYRIAGRMLESLLGEELLPLAESEERIGDGHHFNATLLRKLAPLVPEGKAVKDCVSKRRIKQLVNEIGGSKHRRAA